jgi:hypothetical protein
VSIAESDSLENVEAYGGNDTWHTESVTIYADCMYLSLAIGWVSFKHIWREANKVTHELARACVLDKVSCNWDIDPCFLLNSLLNDVTFIGD